MAVIKNETGTHSLEIEADGSVNVNVVGGATSSAQTTTNNLLTTIDADTSSINTSVASVDAKTPSLVSGRVPVDPSGVTSPVSIASLPLPSGAATDTKQDVGNTSLSSIDTKLSSPLTVNVGLTDTQLRASAVPVSVSGVATSANQTTGNSSLSSIDTKTPALVTGRVPVDGSGVTQPVSFTRLSSGTDSVTAIPSGTQTVSGTVAATQSGVWNVTNVSGTVSLPTGASTAALQTTGNSSLSAIDSKLGGTLAVSATSLPLPTGAATAAKQLADNHQVTVSNFPATQAVSAASLPLPTGASTSVLQTSGNSTLTAIDTKLGATLSVNVGLTDTQLRATPVVVSLSGGATEAKQDVGNASLSSIDAKTATLVGGKVPVVLPTNAATDTLQTSGNASLTAIDSKLGGTLTVNVGLTDTQLRASAVPVTVSGVATAANQTTGNSSLSSIDSKIVAVNTGAVVVSSSALPTDASTATLQSAGNVSVDSIDTKTPALIAGRQPVTTKDYGYDVALGNISGSSTITLRGYNQATSTTNEPLWAQSGTSYPTVTAAQTLTLSSSSVLDIAVTGTGARTVAVTYILFSTGAEVTNVFSLNGVTPVTITTDGYAINSVRVLTKGTGVGNAGVIYVGYGTVTAGVPANILSTIVIGKNNAQQAIYTVPATKVLELWAYRLSSSILTYIQFRTVAANGGIMVVEFDIPLNGVTAFTSVAPSLFSAGTQIQIWGQSTAAGVAGCLISGYLRSV